jgi:hypothetical protein
VANRTSNPSERTSKPFSKRTLSHHCHLVQSNTELFTDRRLLHLDRTYLIRSLPKEAAQASHRQPIRKVAVHFSVRSELLTGSALTTFFFLNCQLVKIARWQLFTGRLRSARALMRTVAAFTPARRALAIKRTDCPFSFLEACARTGSFSITYLSVPDKAGEI